MMTATRLERSGMAVMTGYVGRAVSHRVVSISTRGAATSMAPSRMRRAVVAVIIGCAFTD
jgi:hypothetical protein